MAGSPRNMKAYPKREDHIRQIGKDIHNPRDVENCECYECKKNR